MYPVRLGVHTWSTYGATNPVSYPGLAETGFGVFRRLSTRAHREDRWVPRTGSILRGGAIAPIRIACVVHAIVTGRGPNEFLGCEIYAICREIAGRAIAPIRIA